MKLRVAIIDDEIHAIETLTYDLTEDFSDQVEIVFSSTDPLEGAMQLRKELPDLLFLDIDMPVINGFDLMKLVDDLNIRVVLTTAHQEYAIQAVGTKAIAYILKPVLPDSLQKVMQQIVAQKQNNIPYSALKDKISVPDMEGMELIPYSDILYCKSDGNYTELILSDRKKTASKTLKYFDESLPPEQFIRIHKSFLINLEHVRRYLKVGGGELVMKNGDILPVSRNNRQNILNLMQNFL